MEFTTNYFQCVDVLLTNGLNTIAVHATDLAGNVTTTNLNLTLDYSSATNPVINLYWPQNNTVIVGNSFTFRGWVDDPAATVFAQIVDSNNDTNIVQAIVERDGKFWAQNLPLTAGTSTVTLMVTNSALLPNATNIFVVQSTLNMTINPITDNLWLPTVNVSGTISDPGDYKVWVNGTNATVIGNNWTAQNVPVPQGGGVAAIQVRAIPYSENGGNGTGGNGGGPVKFDNLGNPDPTPDNDLETGALPRQEEGVVVDSAIWSSDYGDEISEQTLEVDQTEGNYTRTNGGEYSDFWESKSIAGVVGWTRLTVDELAPRGAIADEYVEDSYTGYHDLGPGGQFSFPLEEGSLHFPQNSYDYWDRTTEIHMALPTGGFGVFGQQAVVSVQTSAAAEQVNISGGVSTTPIDNTQVSIPGLGRNLGSDGFAYGTTFIGGPPVDVTPTVGVRPYSFTWPVATVSALSITANGNELSAAYVPTFCVGQDVSFAPRWDGDSTPNVVNTTAHWTLPETFVNEQPHPYCLAFYDENANLLNNYSTSCWFVSGSGGMCRVTVDLFFSNGQKVIIQAFGGCSVVAPSLEDAVFYPITALFKTNANGTEQMDVYANFDAWVRPPVGFSGTASFTQLIDTSYNYYWPLCYPHSFTTSNGYWLDNFYPYAEQYVSWDDKPLNSVIEDDSPGLDPHSYCYAITNVDAYKTYLQFCPDGGIPVTIASLTWGWTGTASETGGIWSGSATPQGPTPNMNDNSFPLWTNIYHNGE